MKTTTLLGQTFPVYDKRDGEPDAYLAFKVLGTEVLGLPWNAWLSRGLSGLGYREANLSHVAQLVREATKNGETVIGASLCNYAVEIAVRMKL